MISQQWPSHHPFYDHEGHCPVIRNRPTVRARPAELIKPVQVAWEPFKSIDQGNSTNIIKAWSGTGVARSLSLSLKLSPGRC